jgi:hypothetical protein
MGFQKYECSKCGREYYEDADHPRDIIAPPPLPKCPNAPCHKHKLTAKRFVLRQPKTGSPLHALALHRPLRGAAAPADYRAPAYDFGSDDDGPSSSEDDDEDDEDFLPPARDYNVAMRFHGGRHAVRAGFPAITDILTCPWTQIGMPAGRASTNAVMGLAINGRGNLSAQKHSGRGVAYKVNRFRSEEWCHLLADSLGGPTSAANLVAAGYAANTFMAVIESKIQRNNKLDVKVKVYCSAPWVAEHIVYKLRATGNSAVQITFSIDAVCTDFDATDAVFYGGQVTAWLKANHLEK